MSDSSLAMMPWFPRDFLASTRAMRLAERGAYRELLDYQWEMGTLPSDPERLARLLGISPDEFVEIWPAIEHKFVDRDGGLVNKRLEEHRDKALEQRDKKRRAAEKTNAQRYGKRADSDTPSGSHSDAVSETLSGSPPSPSPSPSPTEKEKKARANGARVPSRHIDLIFSHWQTVHKHPNAKCDEKRRRLIAARLKDFSLEELRRCIDGYALSPFHRGDNPSATKYDSIELMMRDTERVENGLKFAQDPPKDVARGTNRKDRKPSAVERAQRATGGGF